MPELPEVEVVRRGLARWVTGARIGDVEVLHPRPVRRHEAGPEDFAARLRGAAVTDVVRRGKFCWLELDSGEALLAHLGMSGQVLLRPPDADRERHLRVRLALDGGALDPAEGRELRFVDQRMFGGLAVVPLVPTPDGGPGGRGGSAPQDADTEHGPTCGRRPGPGCRRRSRTSPGTRSTRRSTSVPSWPAGGCAGPASRGRCSTRR